MQMWILRFTSFTLKSCLKHQSNAIRFGDFYYRLIDSMRDSSVIYSSPVTPPSPSYVTHYWKPFSGDLEVRQIQRTTLLESRTLIEQGTTGMRTWPASLFLARFLVSEPGRRCICISTVFLTPFKI
jgi:hypothetical protein